MVNLFQLFLLLLMFNTLYLIFIYTLLNKFKNINVPLTFFGLTPAYFCLVAMLLQVFFEIGDLVIRQILANLFLVILGIKFALFNKTLKRLILKTIFSDNRKVIGDSNLEKVFNFLKFSLYEVVIFFPIISLNFLPGGSQINFFDVFGLIICLSGFFVSLIAARQLRSISSSGGIVKSAYGLWTVTRHPILIGHLISWWGIYLLSYNAIGGGWSIVGPLLISYLYLVLYIDGIEEVLSKKILDYGSYQLKTPKIFNKIKF